MGRKTWLLFPLYALLRAGLAWGSPLPGALPLDPLPVFLALWMRDREGKDLPGLLFLPGLILGDMMTGMGGAVLVGRSVMLLAFCLIPEEGGFHRRAWLWTFTYALGTAILIDLQGWMPLGLVTLAGVVQGFLWWGVLAPKAGGGTLRGAAGSLLLPPVALVLLHLLLPSPALWPLPEMGTRSSAWIRFFAMLIFVEPFVWRLWLLTRRSRSTAGFPTDPEARPLPSEP